MSVPDASILFSHLCRPPNAMWAWLVNTSFQSLVNLGVFFSFIQTPTAQHKRRARHSEKVCTPARQRLCEVQKTLGADTVCIGTNDLCASRRKLCDSEFTLQCIGHKKNGSLTVDGVNKSARSVTALFFNVNCVNFTIDYNHLLCWIDSAWSWQIAFSDELK